MKTELTEHETLRRDSWVRAWCACATASNTTSSKVCTTFADACLKAYDERFKPPPKSYTLPLQGQSDE